MTIDLTAEGALKAGLHRETYRALESIDASFFSGDSFHSPEGLAFVQAYLDRWTREAASIRRTSESPASAE